MQQEERAKKAQKRTKKIAGVILCFLASILSYGCISPDGVTGVEQGALQIDKEAIKAEIKSEVVLELQANLTAAFDAEISGIKTELEQTASNQITSGEIQELRNEIEQTTQVVDSVSAWRKSVEAETINYGGAGWVMLGMGFVVVIFVIAALLIVRAFMRRGSMLTMITCAIQKLGRNSPDTVEKFKKQIEKEVAEGKFGPEIKKALADFTKKKGTFAEKNE